MSRAMRLARHPLQSVPAGPVGLRLGAMAMVDAVGTGAFLSVSVVFITRIVHLSPATLGVGLTVSAAIALATAVPIGIIADKVGPRAVLIAVSLWRCGCFVAYPFIRAQWQFFLVVCLLGLVDKAAAPMEQALVSQVVTASDRLRLVAVLRSLRNVGFTLGAALGAVGLLVDTRGGYIVILLANATSFALLAFIAARLRLLAPPDKTLRRRFSLTVLRDRPFLAFAGVNAVLTVHMTLLSIGIPLWVVKHSHAPVAVLSPLLAVNTVLAVAFQVRASRGADGIAGATRALRRAGLSLGACCLLLTLVPGLSAAPAVAVLVLAMVALTGGELFQSAGGWGGSYVLAPADRQGVYLSVFWLSVSLQQIAAPLVLTVVVGSGSVGWIILAAAVAACGIVSPAIGAWAQVPERRPHLRAEPRPVA